jgi:hypothetical protein
MRPKIQFALGDNHRVNVYTSWPRTDFDVDSFALLIMEICRGEVLEQAKAAVWKYAQDFKDQERGERILAVISGFSEIDEYGEEEPLVQPIAALQYHLTRYGNVS